MNFEDIEEEIFEDIGKMETEHKELTLVDLMNYMKKMNTDLSQAN